MPENHDELERYGFVTEDKAIRDARRRTRLGEGDRKIFESMETGGGLIEIESVAQLMALGNALAATFKHYQEICRAKMTHDQAVFIRGLRVDEGYSWRAVAEACYEQEWEGWEQWGPPSSQPMGMALSERAAEFFNENYMEPPWN
jgi:hypothetical protein